MRLLIIIVVLIGLSAVIGAVIVGKDSFEGIVVERPYEQGLLWEKEEQEKTNSGLDVKILNKEFRVGGNELSLSVVNKVGGMVKPGDISVLVSRPSTAAYDRRYTVTRSADDRYLTSVSFPLYGYWDVKVQILRGRDVVVFKSRVFAEMRG
jgi:nitrogen fixation protein FixH